MKKRFKMPAGSRVKELVIRELTGQDELVAAQTAAALLGSKADHREIVLTSRREATKLAIVEIDGRAVDHTIPLVAVDRWSRRDLAALDRFFDSINGLTDEEVRAMYASAMPIDDGEGGFGTSFTLPSRCALSTVTAWETSGGDDIAAARAVESIRTIGLADRVLHQRWALVAQSLRGVVADWPKWSMRTSTAVSLCYQHVNSIPDGELEGLVAAAQDVGEATADPSPGKDSPPSP